MKTIFRASMLGIFTAAAAVSSFAQNPCEDSYETKQAIYQKFKDARKGEITVDKAKVAIQTGEEFVSKYTTCEADKAVVDFIKGKLPELKKFAGEQDRFGRFNASIKDPKNVNAADAFTSGKEIIAASPDTSLDVALVLSSIGFDNVSTKNPPVNTYNNDTITFAKSAIQQIESGRTSNSYGAYAYSYIIKDAQGKVDPVKSKENALAWMNYTIGYIMYYSQNMKKDALPYFYKSAQFSSPVKDKPVIYQAVGAWYLDEILNQDKARLAAIEANGGKDNEATLKMFAMEKGYADRAIDAYARAYKLASADTKTPQAAEYKKALYEKLQGLYKLRFDKTDGIDAYIASVTSKPFPNPATEVTPVVEGTPTTTTTTSSTTTTPTNTTTTTTTTNPSTKPSTTTDKMTTTKPSTTTTTMTKPTASTTTKSTKTTTTKKKGNR